MIDTQSPLYDRIGGEKGIEKLLVGFYARVLADPILKPFFKNAPMEKLLGMQRQLFGLVLGGPHTYHGRPLREVHAKMGIADVHFRRFREHLLEVLQADGVAIEDVRDVVRRVSAYRKDIVANPA